MFANDQKGLPPVNLRPLSPMERDALLLELGYTDHTKVVLRFLKLMDARDDAIRFIAACGMLDEYGRYCEHRDGRVLAGH